MEAPILEAPEPGGDTAIGAAIAIRDQQWAPGHHHDVAHPEN